MKQHTYRVTVEHLADADGNPLPSATPLIFEVGNHDDISDIVKRVHARGEFDENTSTAFAVGLKLFSEVMVENRQHPLFSEFFPHFAAFMKKLKKPPVSE